MTQTENHFFSVFNAENPDDLSRSLMQIFTTISNATTNPKDGSKDMNYVNSILSTTEFIMEAKPELRARLQVIINACVNKMTDEYAQTEGFDNAWMEKVLRRYQKRTIFQRIRELFFGK